MCWSWEVSLIFATIQWIIIGYLIYRNQFLDRYLAACQFFIAAQETLQFFLWVFAIDDETTSTSCSGFNTFISYCLLFLVTSILPCYGLIAALISRKIDGGTKRFYAIIGYTISAFIFATIFEILAIYYDFGRDDMHCSYKGHNGHQIWAYMDIKDLEPSIPIIRTIMWIILVIVLILFVRPNWPISPTAVYAALSLIIARSAVQQSAEWASLWCWANFVESIWYLFTYHIAKYIVEIKQIDEDRSCCTQFWLKGTKAYYYDKIQDSNRNVTSVDYVKLIDETDQIHQL